jgi:hypothetical protein
MSWNDEPDYTPQFKWRDWIWVVLFFAAFVALMGTCTSAEAQSYNESQIQSCACEDFDQEVRTKAGTYVDCLSQAHAIEIESTEDWAEAIGQALHYASETGKRAKVLFFCEARDETCLRHRLSFEATVAFHGLPIEWDYVPEQCLSGALAEQE